MVQVISATEAAAMVKPGSRIAIGGFLAVGAPETITMQWWKMKIITSI
jgi:acyl CoA:acetate/3-ketoacid CoA transferase alpha subunit